MTINKNSNSNKHSRLKKIVFKIGIALAAIVFTLVIVEIALRIFNLPTSTEMSEELKTYLPERTKAYENSMKGSYQPNSTIPVCTREFMTFNKTDSLGYIGTGRQVVEQNEILVFGDSFAYGYGVSSDKSFSSCLNAYNAGLWGTTFPQHVLAFERTVPVIRPKIAIWVVYPPHIVSASPMGWNTRINFDTEKSPFLNSVSSAYNATKISDLILRASGWGLNRSNYHTREWSLYDPLDSSLDDGYICFQKSVNRIVEISHLHGVEVFVLFVPSKTQLSIDSNKATTPISYWASKISGSLPVSRLQEVLISQGISKDKHIDLRPHFLAQGELWRSYYFAEDGHWNEAGHEFVGGVIKKVIRSTTKSAIQSSRTIKGGDH